MTAGTTKEAFVSAFRALEAGGSLGGPAWLRDLRREAIGRFAERGLPTPRDEEWKYTSIAPIEAVGFDLEADGVSDRAADDGLTEDAIAPFCVSPGWSRLVFVDGRCSAKLSAIRPLPRARIESLGETLITDAELLRPHLIRSARAEASDGFAALNAAFWRDGALIHLAPGAAVAEPIHMLFIATGAAPARIDHPRNLVVLEPESRATLIESYVTLGGDAPRLTNATTDIVVGAGAELDHYTLQLEGQDASYVGRTQVRQARGSRVESCAVTFGGRLVRNEVRTRLEAEAAACTLNGLFVIGGRQHVDTHTVVDHVAPRATSRQLYKGILDGRARGVFSGRVIVRPGAMGTDAHQTNKNLLLSDEVEVDSKPQLEIFADDVKCSHGAADGQLATDAIFYLKSRGLDEEAARTLLTFGFANEVLARIRVEPLRARLETLLTARLRGGRVANGEPGEPAASGLRHFESP